MSRLDIMADSDHITLEPIIPTMAVFLKFLDLAGSSRSKGRQDYGYCAIFFSEKIIIPILR